MKVDKYFSNKYREQIFLTGEFIIKPKLGSSLVLVTAVSGAVAIAGTFYTYGELAHDW